MPRTSRPDRQSWFDPASSPTAKLRAVTKRSRLTWQDYYEFCWCFPQQMPQAVRRAVAQRLDVMSAPYEDTLLLPNGGSFGMPGMLRVLLEPRTGARDLWTTLLTRATPEGRRRLVAAYGDVEDEGRGYGNVWCPEVWPLLPSAYTAPTLDETTAQMLLDILETGLHREDPSSAPGELWAKAVAACDAATASPYLTRLITNLSRWFLAEPSRLSTVAVSTLLASPHAATRTWVLTEIVPRRPGPTVDATRSPRASRSTPRRPRPR